MKTHSLSKQNRFLTHPRTIVCALAMFCASLAFPSSAIDGARRAVDTPEPVTGGFFPCFNYARPPRQVGENVIVTFNVTTDVTGTLDGSLVGTELDVVHPDGSINLHGTAVFNGSIGGRSGTFLLTYTGIGNAVTGHETLHFVGNRGTGDLTGVQLQGTAEGDLGAPSPGCDVSGAGSYTGQIVFAP